MVEENSLSIEEVSSWLEEYHSSNDEKVKKIMSLDFSWNKTAKEYIEVYNEF